MRLPGSRPLVARLAVYPAHGRRDLEVRSYSQRAAPQSLAVGFDNERGSKRPLW
jgi:hypothetical protein